MSVGEVALGGIVVSAILALLISSVVLLMSWTTEEPESRWCALIPLLVAVICMAVGGICLLGYFSGK